MIFHRATDHRDIAQIAIYINYQTRTRLVLATGTIIRDSNVQNT